MAKVVLARSAPTALGKLDFLLADATLDALGELERDPQAGRGLRGRLTGLRSFRVGAYRIIYERRDATTVRVVAIRHRGQAYDTDPRRAAQKSSWLSDREPDYGPTSLSGADEC